MSSKDISYLELWQRLYSSKWNHLCNFGSSHQWVFFAYYMFKVYTCILKLCFFIIVVLLRLLFFYLLYETLRLSLFPSSIFLPIIIIDLMSRHIILTANRALTTSVDGNKKAEFNAILDYLCRQTPHIEEAPRIFF